MTGITSIPLSQVALTHLEGGTWQFLVIGRYKSAQNEEGVFSENIPRR